MAYDFPYRLEQIAHVRHEPPFYQITRSDTGIVCTGENFNEMRKLIEAANEAALTTQGVRGR